MKKSYVFGWYLYLSKICLFFYLFAVSIPVVYSSEPKAPSLDVPSALLMEPRTGTLLYKKNIHARLAPASLVKLMTLYLAFEFLKKNNIDFSTPITISRKASRIGGRQVYLKEQEKLTVDELLKSTAIFSANDAAYALAEFVAGTEENFVGLMNEKAKQMGMIDTHYYNSHGLPKMGTSEKQYTTAWDLAILTRFIMADYPEIFNYTRIKKDSIRNGAFSLVTTDLLLLQRSDVYGVKTGYIRAAGYCVVNTAHQEDFHLISIIMGARNKKGRFALSSRLLDYGFKNFQFVEITSLPEEKSIPLKSGKEDSVDIALSSNIPFVCEKGTASSIAFTYFIPDIIQAPVAYRARVGWIEVSADGKYCQSVQAVASKSVAQKISWWKKIIKHF